MEKYIILTAVCPFSSISRWMDTFNREGEMLFFLQKTTSRSRIFTPETVEAITQLLPQDLQNE